MLVARADAQDQKSIRDKEAEYRNIAVQRADKIVGNLGLTDESKANKVRDIIAGQYSNLNLVQLEKEEAIKAINASVGEDKKLAAERIKKEEDKADAKIERLHASYLKSLSKNLTTEQVDRVKDGMTYNVLPITYKGYLEMLPNLTGKQKAQILAWLVEAREHAIDAGSSEKKHWWFGKYKGRINNYLSAEGVDTKTAREIWEKKLKEEQLKKEG